MKILKAHKLTVLGVAVLAGAALAGCLLRGCAAKREFATASEFRDWAKSHGLHVYPDTDGGWISHLASDTLTTPQLKTAPINPGRVDNAWRGVICVVSTKTLGHPPPVPYRVWGGVIAYGCPELLERVEALR